MGHFTTLDAFKHAQRERLVFLDHCFTWRGMANRRDLIDRFGISAAQAALDFAVYVDLTHKAAPTYDPVRRTYIAASRHRPLAPSSMGETCEVLNLDLSALPQPERKVDPAVIARLYRASRSGKALHIRYAPLTAAADDAQWIAPVRFISDGESVFLRAFSFRHGAYQNYLPLRIEPDSPFDDRPLSEPLPEDEDWHTKAIVWLRPSAELSDEQADAVRREFGFEGEFLRVETRKALESFFDRRWGLDERDARLERAKTSYEPRTS